MGEWFRRLRYLLNRRRADEALKQEMEGHRAAMDHPATFGNTLRLREEGQDVWGWTWLDNIGRDLRFAGRALRRSSGFTVGAVSSLAVGLAVTASAIAVTNAYLIRSFPYAAVERLYNVRYAPPGPWEPGGMSALDWTSVNDVVEFPITASGATFYLTDGGYAQPVRGLRVTRGFVEGLGVRAVAGRTLIDGDFLAAPTPSALIGFHLWRDRFGSDPGAIGRLIRTETGIGPPETFRIVGVLPPSFFFGADSRQQVEVIVPLSAQVRTYMVRLRSGVPPDIAERRITEAARAVARELPADWSGVQLESTRERYVADSRPVLIGVTVAAGLVLVIVCANVAVLVGLRTVRREKEIAVRLALGSGRSQLARMLFAEAGLVCATALALGLALTHLTLGLVAPLIEAQLGRSAPGGTATIAVDTTVLFIVGVVAGIVTLSLAFVPLVLSWRGQLTDVLRRNGMAATDGRFVGRLRSGMLAFEIAGTLILLVSCGVMIRSVVTMVRTDLGFEPERLVRARIELRASDYADAIALSRFYDQFTSRLSTASGAPVVFSSWPTFVAFPEQAIEIDGRAGYVVNGGAVNVGADYFRTLGIALRSGRDFTREEQSSFAPIAVISETLARRLWPEGGAIGRQLRQVQLTPGGPEPPGPWRTVVGVAADVRQTYGDKNLGDVYTPSLPTIRFGSFYLRTDRPIASLLPALRSVAAEIDPRAVVDLLHPVEEDNHELAGTTFLTTMLVGFGSLAGFIAVLGIYGVTAYAAEQREREVAIRMALGAGGDTIVRLFLRDGVLVLITGLVFGLIGALTAVRALEHKMFAVRAFDVPTLLATSLLLTTASLFATWWPARRASQRSLVSALKDG